MIKILYFGSLPDLLGRGREEMFLPKTVKTSRDLLHYLAQRGEEWQQGLDEARITLTVNREFRELDAPLEDGDEVAIVSKGLGRL
ncbi:MoaD/ThiS family protein [Thiohalobacter sp. IOR34]|uniref:MoaD/ThiS family protein n=1 Tax=Thiohalobacter sp. IOR34 TaxID=3057176 RepID=UPI0025B0DB2B|nr:MoaD/ThiS family protein [Thiohalobacter sp. IOR34]WJW74541.1 MoaD/ThiS family protein [Thiohalobacter sp. IOR34]